MIFSTTTYSGGRRAATPRACRRCAKPCCRRSQVGGRVEQAVGMVDAQAVDPALRGQVQRQALHRLEHPRVLDAQRRQFVDVEEAPVVDLVGRHVPVGQPVGLRLVQRMQALAAGLVVEGLDRRLQRRQPRRPASAAVRPGAAAGADRRPRASLRRLGRLRLRGAIARLSRSQRAATARHRRPRRAAARPAPAPQRRCAGRAESGARRSARPACRTRHRSPGGCRRRSSTSP